MLREGEIKRRSLPFLIVVVSLPLLFLAVRQDESHQHQDGVQTQGISVKSQNNEFNPNSYMITNDAVWRDNHDDILENGSGGKISKINRIWFWVGRKPSVKGQQETAGKGDIYLYKSKHLGSNSWEIVQKIASKDGKGAGKNCQIHEHPTIGTYHIFCKDRRFLIGSDGMDGNFTFLPKQNDPSNLQHWAFGGSSTFQEGEDLYYIVSRCNKKSGRCLPSTRRIFIYKLNRSWTGFASAKPVVTSWTWPKREAPFIFKRNKQYYLTASETRGWKPSRTWFRKASTLPGLENATDVEVKMHPDNPKLKSMGSQFRFIIQAADEKWLYGGSRYPVEDPIHYDEKYGRYILAPVNFISDAPHVFWKKAFCWNKYNYTSGDYDEHSSPIRLSHLPLPENK